jgi:hypothetical protein
MPTFSGGTVIARPQPGHVIVIEHLHSFALDRPEKLSDPSLLKLTLAARRASVKAGAGRP